MRLSIHIVTWNSQRFLPTLFESLGQQRFHAFDVIVIDNASEDGSLSIIEHYDLPVTVVRNPRNRGFAWAHNQAIELVKKRIEAGQQYDGVVVLNPDIILTPTTLEVMANALRQYPQCASVGVPLYKAHDRDEEGFLLEQNRFEQFDSLGLQLSRAHQFRDSASGMIDRGDIVADQFVFGISGACCLYRWEAIEELLKFDGEFFDQSFFSYKEDVDVAWRLQLRGWKSVLVHSTRAYHYRGVGMPQQISLLQRIRQRKQRGDRIKQVSYRNHFITIIKNQSLINILLALPWIVPYEFGKFVIIFFTEPTTLIGGAHFLLSLPTTLRKRSIIQSTARVSASSIRLWYVS